MENKLSNEEIEKVFHLYWGNTKAKVKETSPWIYGDCEYCVRAGAKLLLKPLSAITDEDAIEVAKLDLNIPTAETGKFIVDRINRLGGGDNYTIQYLISKGYAVPLFFGVNHWANGKTAIELGIALTNK